MASVNYVDNVFPYTNPTLGNVTFTGPDGLRDYQPHLVDDVLPVGIGFLSPQETTSTGYLFRPAPDAPFERPRSSRPGEIGWGLPGLADWQAPLSGQQIVLGDMRQLAEDRSTHSLLGAWYPRSDLETPMGSDGFYKENIYSGRPGTANVRYMTPPSPGGGADARTPPTRDRHCSPQNRRSYSPHRPASCRINSGGGGGRVLRNTD